MSVFENIKRLFKHSAIYGIGHIISRSINFLLLPLYTHVLPPKSYGVVGIMFTYIAIFMIFYTYGLDAAFFRFYMLEDNKASKKQVFSTAFYSLLLTSLIFSGTLLISAESIANTFFSADVKKLSIDLTLLIRTASAILFFDTLAFLPFLMLRAEERPSAFVFYKALFVFLNLAGNVIFLVILRLGVEGIFLANGIASVTTFLLLLPMTLKHIGQVYSFAKLKELLAFGLPYIVVNAAFVVMDTIDRPLVERLADIEAAGLYNAGVKLGMFMALSVAAFRFAWFPFFLSHAKQENAKSTFSKVLTYVLLTCLFIFLILSFFIDHIAHFSIFGKSIVGPEFWESTVVVPLIMLAYIFYAAYCNFLIGVYLKKKTQYLSYITAAGMLGNVIANFILIPRIGFMGAAWARLIAYLIMATVLYTVAQRLYHIQYEWRRILKLCIVVALLFVIGSMGTDVVKGLILIFFPVCLYIIGFWDKSELNKMRQWMGRIMHFNKSVG